MATAAATAPAGGSTPPVYVDTQHEDLIHDAQMDFYGSKLATCSSDRTIKIYNVSESSYEISATLQGHEGPVWQVSWAHPKFGVILASASFDGSVLIHAEGRPREWTVLHAARSLHASSINSVAFGPHEYGLVAAAASSDGRVSVLQHLPNQTWKVDYLQDCRAGVNAVSWAPFGAYSSPVETSSEGGEGEAPDMPRLVSAGCDGQIRFYKRVGEDWIPDETQVCDTDAATHTDWIRDVAWAPCLVPNNNMLATCSENGKVIIWKQAGAEAVWTPTVLPPFEATVWRVSWSVSGHVLAVSSGQDVVTLWKEGLDHEWTQVSSIDSPAPGPST